MNLFGPNILKNTLAAFVIFGGSSSFAKDLSLYSTPNSGEGFIESSDDYHVVTTIFDVITPPQSYKSMLTVSFSCVVKDSIFPFAPRFKNVKWSFMGTPTNAKATSRAVVTDTNGIVKIVFSSRQSLRGKQVEISIGTTKKIVQLGSGPYAFEIGEDGCLNAR
jgi:hypothetical protein